MSKTLQVDIVVIGSGPGGYAAAFRAADLGQKVLMIDKDSDRRGGLFKRGGVSLLRLFYIFPK